MHASLTLHFVFLQFLHFSRFMQVSFFFYSFISLHQQALIYRLLVLLIDARAARWLSRPAAATCAAPPRRTRSGRAPTRRSRRRRRRCRRSPGGRSGRGRTAGRSCGGGGPLVATAAARTAQGVLLPHQQTSLARHMNACVRARARTHTHTQTHTQFSLSPSPSFRWFTF